MIHRSMAASDHCLLSLSLRVRGPRRAIKRRFMFEEMWTREESCREVIESAWDPWNCSPAMSIQKRLQRCKGRLQDWNYKVFGNVNRVLKQKQRRLQQLEELNLLHESAEEIQGLKKEINEVLFREELMWNQRSRALWIKCGDRNTKFFHATANNRQRKNKIEGICDPQGRWREDRVVVENIILEYFTEIYSTSYPTEFEASLGAVGRRVSEAMNTELLREFKEEEVW